MPCPAKVERMKTLCSLVALLAVALAVPLLGAEREDDVVRQATSRMSAAAGVDLRTTTSSLTGRLTFVSVPGGRSVAPGDADVLPAPERATRFLGLHGAAFGLGSESRAVVRRTEPRDAVGLDHVRLQQTYRGVPVTGGEILVHLRGQEVVAVNGKALPGISVQTEPHVSPERALEIVRDLALGSLGASEVELSVPELQILNRGLLDGTRRPTHLAWFVVAVSERLREYVWVDAHRGAVVLHFSQRPQAKNRTVFNSGNSDALPGTQIGSEASPPTGDADAVAAFDHAGDAYDYFWGTHGRDSYDGAGGELRSSVHYCETTCPMADAFWNGTQMVYGEGYAR
jgi:bacillolysin